MQDVIKERDINDELNPYAFLGNGPVNQADYFGLSSCPPGKCDKWSISLTTIATGAVGASLLAAGAVLRPSSCCDFPAKDYTRDYRFLGGGVGAGARFTITLGTTYYDFETDCIGWDEHTGAGLIALFGAGIWKTFGSGVISTPQTAFNLRLTDPGTGFDFSVIISIGRWWVVSPSERDP